MNSPDNYLNDGIIWGGRGAIDLVSKMTSATFALKESSQDWLKHILKEKVSIEREKERKYTNINS